MFNKVEVKTKKGKVMKTTKKLTPRALRAQNRIKRIKNKFENKRLVYKAKLRKLRAEHRKEIAKQKNNLRAKRKIIREQNRKLRMIGKLATKFIKIITMSVVQPITSASAKTKTAKVKSTK